MGKKIEERYQRKVARWHKEGRGDGRGSDYKPWLTVRDVPSQGRSHRVYGRVAKRIHHFFSDLELSIFFILDWNSGTRDIREQFPLRIEDTQKLAKDSGIKHPAQGAEPMTMTSDFLVNASGSSLPQFALQAKLADDLDDPRTVEKLEIERLYWRSKEIPWFVVTERDVPKVAFENISWLHPDMDDGDMKVPQPDKFDHYRHHFKKNPNQSLIEVAKELDRAYNMAPGESLAEIRNLLAQRFFHFNITKPYRVLTGADMIPLADRSPILELVSVSQE